MPDLQGRKQVCIGEQTPSFGPGECLLVSRPARSKVTKAPFLLIFKVDVATMGSSSPTKLRNQRSKMSVLVQRRRIGRIPDCSMQQVDTCAWDLPADAKVLGPLISQEIHYRLLVAPFGGMLRRLVHYDSHASAVARAIGHIRGDIRSSIAIPDSARRVGMSGSSFHKHFKTITATTPLQYQKELRLLEARLPEDGRCFGHYSRIRGRL